VPLQHFQKNLMKFHHAAPIRRIRQVICFLPAGIAALLPLAASAADSSISSTHLDLAGTASGLSGSISFGAQDNPNTPDPRGI
jgi:hypothetical protein